MTFLKNLAVSLFSFILFLALGVFGLAFALKSTVLDPNFIAAELNNLEIASLVNELVQIESPPEMPDLDYTFHQTISDIEPQLKEQADSAIHSVYDYLLGEKSSPELASTFRNTFLSTEFITPLVNSLDIPSLAGPFVTEQFAQSLPMELPHLDQYITDFLTASEPVIKKQIVAALEPAFGYHLGIISRSEAAASIEKAEKTLGDSLLPIFISSLPPELAIVPRQLKEDYFNQFYQEFTAQVNTNLLDAKMRSEIVQGINNAEEGLWEARQYVAMFQQYYIILIVLMVMLAMGIILLVRNVKDICHRLGIPLVTYGAIEYAGIWATKYFISRGKLHFAELPPELETWLLQLINDLLKPLEIFSLAILIGGAVLVIASFLYKPGKDLNWT